MKSLSSAVLMLSASWLLGSVVAGAEPIVNDAQVAKKNPKKIAKDAKSAQQANAEKEKILQAAAVFEAIETALPEGVTFGSNAQGSCAVTYEKVYVPNSTDVSAFKIQVDLNYQPNKNKAVKTSAFVIVESEALVVQATVTENQFAFVLGKTFVALAPDPHSEDRVRVVVGQTGKASGCSIPTRSNLKAI